MCSCVDELVIVTKFARGTQAQEKPERDKFWERDLSNYFRKELVNLFFASKSLKPFLPPHPRGVSAFYPERSFFFSLLFSSHKMEQNWNKNNQTVVLLLCSVWSGSVLLDVQNFRFVPTTRDVVTISPPASHRKIEVTDNLFSLLTSSRVDDVLKSRCGATTWMPNRETSFRLTRARGGKNWKFHIFFFRKQCRGTHEQIARAKKYDEYRKSN